MIIIKRFYGVPGLCLKKLESGERPGGGGGVLPRILDRGVSRRFVNPNPI